MSTFCLNSVGLMSANWFNAKVTSLGRKRGIFGNKTILYHMLISHVIQRGVWRESAVTYRPETNVGYGLDQERIRMGG